MKRFPCSLTAALLICCMLVAMLASCSGNLEEDAPKADGDKSPLVILLAKTTSQDGAPNSNGFNVFLTKIAKAFNESGKGEVILKEYEPGEVAPITDRYIDDYYDEYQRLKANGETPDIVLFHPEITNRYSEFYKYIVNGDLADMAPYLESDRDYHAEDYVQAVMDGGKIGAGQFFIPLLYKSYACAGFEEKSAQAGAPLPSQNLDFNQFWQAIGRTNKWAADHAVSTWSDYLTPAVMLQGDTPVIDIQNGKINFDAPDFQTLLKMYTSTFDPVNYKITGGVFGIDAVDQNMACVSLDPFYYQIDIYVAMASKAKGPYAQNHPYVMALPSSADPSKHNAEITMAMGVSADSKKKNRAYDFIKFCMNSEMVFPGIIKDYSMDYDSIYVNKKMEKKYIGDHFAASKERYMQNEGVTEPDLKNIFDSLYKDITSIHAAAPYYQPLMNTLGMYLYMYYSQGTTLDECLSFVERDMKAYIGIK